MRRTTRARARRSLRRSERDGLSDVCVRSGAPCPEIELAFDVRKMYSRPSGTDSRDVKASVESVGQQIRQTKDTIAGLVQRPLDTAAEHLLVPAVLSVLRGLRAKKAQS